MRMDIGGIKRAYYNFDTQTTTNDGISSTMEDYGNGWFKCTFTFNAITATGVFYPNESAANLYIYGAMLEAGSYSTSYIPTSGTMVTRLQDACSATGLSNTIGQTEGTLYSEFIVNGFTNFGTPLCINNGSTNESIWLTTFGNGDIRAEVFSVAGGGIQASFTKSGNTTGQIYKIAIGYAANNFAFYVNGTQVGTTDTSGVVPSGMSRIDYDYGNATTFSKSALQINQTQLYKTRLTNAELATLTTL